MLLAMLPPQRHKAPTDGLWRSLTALSVLALVFTVLAVFMAANSQSLLPWLRPTRLGTVLAVLVQLLGTVIAVFSSRYLEGEHRQRRYMAALAGVLAAVHLLLLADHWAVLIVAWALVGVALQHLLCFYPDRPFALLAAYKKRIADRIADAFLLGAAALAWSEEVAALCPIWRPTSGVKACPRPCNSARWAWCWPSFCARPCCRCMAG